MKRRMLLIGAIACLATRGTLSGAEFAGGTGEPNDPYQIATAAQLLAIGYDPELLDKHYVLIADIDVNPDAPGSCVFGQALIAPSTFSDLCGSNFTGASFTGVFDGKGHTIYGFRIDTVCFGHDYLGLFGVIGKAGVVCNLNVCDAIVSANEYSAYLSLMAGVNKGTIFNCRVVGQVYYPDQKYDEPVGGFVGSNEGIIARCRATTSVALEPAFDVVGGFSGDNSGLILQCHCDAAITTGCRGEGPIGGLVGHNSGSICQCSVVNDLDINGYGRHGGLVGVNEGSVAQCATTGRIDDGGWGYVAGLIGRNRGPVRQCYAATIIAAGATTEIAAGLIGRGDRNVTQCFWDVQRSRQPYSDGGTGLSTAEMKTTQTYLDAGWDWIGERANGACQVWCLIDEGREYPQLVWNSDPGYVPEFVGSGTPEDPYQIATVADLGDMTHGELNAHYALAADIDLSQTTWVGTVIPPVVGRLDGAGKTISNLCLQDIGYAGFSGAISSRAEVVNLGITSARVVSPAFGVAAAILTPINMGCVRNCYATGYVEGEDLVGGLVAQNHGTIDQCYSAATVTGRSFVGGLAGLNDQTIACSYVRGDVASRDTAGGVVGMNNGIMTQCYTSGCVWGAWNIGALAGVARRSVEKCYHLHTSDSPDNGAGIPLSDSQMMQQVSFVDWDFDTIWSICEGQDYPRLQWEAVSCGQ